MEEKKVLRRTRRRRVSQLLSAKSQEESKLWSRLKDFVGCGWLYVLVLKVVK